LPELTPDHRRENRATTARDTPAQLTNREFITALGLTTCSPNSPVLALPAFARSH